MRISRHGMALPRSGKSGVSILIWICVSNVTQTAQCPHPNCKGGDEAIRRYVQNLFIQHGSAEGFLAREKELEQEKKKEKQLARFVETERRKIMHSNRGAQTGIR